jgi:glycosyltransferase involved in cell wall biosynthesis
MIPTGLPRVVICRSNSILPDPRVEKEARALSNAGHKVEIIGWDMRGDLPEIEDKGGYQIHRRRVGATFGKGMANIGNELRWQLALLFWLIRRRKSYDILHACDFDTVLTALLCKWLFGKSVVYDVFDFYADMLRATPQLIKSIIRKVDIWVMGRVDAVILADEARREQIRGAKPRKLVVIYNTPEDQARHDLCDNSKPVVGTKLKIAYVGTLHVDRGLRELLAVIEGHPEWQLDLAGYGRDENEVLRIANNLPNVNWHGRIPYEKAMRLNAEADVLVATYNPRVANHRYTSPNKLFEAMMLGKPVIVAQGTSVDDKVRQAQCGMVVEYGDANDLDEALQSMETVEIRQKLGQNGRTAYQEQYDWRIMAERMLGLYREIYPSMLNQTV